MALQEHNYWLTTTDFPKTESHLLPERVDVAVIGAGFTGLSAARTLAKRGAKVAVLEARPSAGEPVPATAAWCSPA
jgi:glycine/D-amino acid oxidase-like deaminating enzyme